MTTSHLDLAGRRGVSTLSSSDWLRIITPPSPSISCCVLSRLVDATRVSVGSLKKKHNLCLFLDDTSKCIIVHSYEVYLSTTKKRKKCIGSLRAKNLSSSYYAVVLGHVYFKSGDGLIIALALIY